MAMLFPFMTCFAIADPAPDTDVKSVLVACEAIFDPVINVQEKAFNAPKSKKEKVKDMNRAVIWMHCHPLLIIRVGLPLILAEIISKTGAFTRGFSRLC